MTTLADIKSRIADDLDRQDMASQIDRECKRAVQHYERQRFWFNEAQVTITTSIQQAAYAVPSDFLFSDSMELYRTTGNLVKLNELPWSRYLDEWRYATTSGGQPIDWSYYMDQIWVGPMPNAEYVTVLSYVKTFGPQSFSDGTENAWTNFADDLITARVEKSLAAKTIGMKPDQIVLFAQLELSAWNALSALNDQRLMTGTPRPWRG